MDSRSLALIHAIALSLNPNSENHIGPFIQEAHPCGSDTAVALFYASSIIFLFSVTFSALLKSYLNHFLLHGGRSMIEDHAELKRWQSDLFVRAPEVMILIALSLLLCGLFSLAVT